MAQKHLEISGIETLFNTSRSEGVAQDVGGNLLGDAGAVGDAADDLLDAAGGVAEGVVKGKIIGQDGKSSFGERHDAAFCFLTERAAFAVDQEPAILPEDVLFSEAGQLRDAQAGVEQR